MRAHLSPEIATGELTLARSIAEADHAFEAMLREPRPGFQIGPEVPINAVLGLLTARMRRYKPDFSFNNSVHMEGRPEEGIPHMDDGLVMKNAGVAVHETTDGEGDVTLQLARPGETLFPKSAAEFVGPCLRGKLSPGIKTIFSEGIYSDRGIILGGTYHLFNSTSGTRRSFTRYAYIAPESSGHLWR